MADYYKESAENKIKRMLIVERVRDLVQGGNAGFIPRLGVVDRREYPNTMSLPYCPYIEPTERKEKLKNIRGV